MEDVDRHTTCSHSQRWLQTRHIRRTFVAGSDNIVMGGLGNIHPAILSEESRGA